MEIGDIEDIFRPPFHPYTYELLIAVPSIDRSRKPRNRLRSGQKRYVSVGMRLRGTLPTRQLGTLCERESPPWRDVTSRHRIRCFIPLPELTMRAQEDLLHLNMSTAGARQ